MIKDAKQIEIAKIENLAMIYFYDAEFFSYQDEKFLGLTINYGKGKSLSYDYTSPYYEEFLNKVLNCYQEEEKKALVLGEISNKIVDLFLTNSKSDDIKSKVTSKVIFYDNLLDKDILSGYFTDILNSFLQLHLHVEDVKVNDFVGFKDKYLIRYEYLSKNLVAPIEIFKTDEEIYHFRLIINHVEEDIHDVCEGNIRYSEERVYIKWVSKATEVRGDILYSPEKGYNEATLTHELKTIALDQMIHEVTDKEKEILNCYSNLILGLPLGKVIPTVSNQYLLQEDSKLSDDKIKKDYINLTLLDDIAVLKKKVQVGSFLGKDFSPIFSEKENVVIIPVKKDDKNYLFLQHHYLDSNYSTGLDKKYKNDNYSYELVSISEIDSLKQPFEIKQVIDITNDIEMQNEIKYQICLGRR